jgi:acid phosphatase
MIRGTKLAVLATAAGLAVLGLATSQSPATGAVASPTKVLTIVEENHSYAQAKAGMPYLMSLASKYAYASNDHGVTHPSLPNYLALAGGDTFGVSTDGEPIPSTKVGTAKTVFDLALDKGLRAKAYQESMTSNCQTTSGGGYAARHNPWVYFGSSRSRCKSYDVPAGSFLTDVHNNALPNAGMLIPNVCNDGHDCSLTVADNWLKARLPTLLASTDFTSGRLTVVVTFDEDDIHSGNQVLTVVLNAALSGKHKVVTTWLDHYSLSGYYSHVLRASRLRKATSGFSTAFGLP